MDKILERLTNEFVSEDARYAYADAATNAFLTSQIKALQEERGLTQEELAELMGTQQSGISRWLHSGFSTCKVDTLRKFARVYGVRLRITFEEFGSLPEDVRGFTKRRLAPLKFEDDPAFKRSANEESEKAKTFNFQAQGNAIGVSQSQASASQKNLVSDLSAGASAHPRQLEATKTKMPPAGASGVVDLQRTA